MSRPFSIYLDLVRFGAALMVLLEHAALAGLSLGILGRFGHDAVVTFFVLSGLVICHAVHRRDDNLVSYAVSRFARLWSVVLPALVLVIVLGIIGTAIKPEWYSDFTTTSPQVYIANLLFINQLWYFDFQPHNRQPILVSRFRVLVLCLVRVDFLSTRWSSGDSDHGHSRCNGPKIVGPFTDMAARDRHLSSATDTFSKNRINNFCRFPSMLLNFSTERHIRYARKSVC
jgi:acyltransferase-like protein